MTADERWARRVIKEICRDYGIGIPELIWRQSASKGYSSGHCWWTAWPHGRIVVTAGRPDRMDPHYKGLTPSVDARSTFLHEMAHLITEKGHSSDWFWTVTWELIRKYKLPIAQCKVREGRKGGGRKAYLATRPGRVTYNGRELGHDPVLARAFRL